ncbi:MAG: DtxR family transcriptional regulator [Firmicutes bacterium]|nr:DtxR family transcriptional regulator [Bacillota bacterium]
MVKEKSFYTVRGYEILGKRKEVLSHSMEDYLEMVYRTSLEGEDIRINTLAESLNVQAPSATKMVQKLGKLGLLHYEKYGSIQLTPKGKKIGKFLLKRHKIIEEFINVIGVEEEKLVNVELIEHNVTRGALKKIEILNHFFQSHPEVYEKFKQYRISYQKEGGETKDLEDL